MHDLINMKLRCIISIIYNNAAKFMNLESIPSKMARQTVVDLEIAVLWGRIASWSAQTPAICRRNGGSTRPASHNAADTASTRFLPHRRTSVFARSGNPCASAPPPSQQTAAEPPRRRPLRPEPPPSFYPRFPICS